MFVQFHLLLFGQIVQIASTTVNLRELSHKGHVHKNGAQNHPGHNHRYNKVRTRDVGLRDLTVLPSRRHSGVSEGHIYFIRPNVRTNAVRNIRKGDFLLADEERYQGVEEDGIRRYFEGPTELRKLTVDEKSARPSEELKVDVPQTHQGILPKSDFTLLDNIIAKMTPEAQNTLVDIILKHLDDRSKFFHQKQVLPNPPTLMKPSTAQDRSALPNLLISALDNKNDVNYPPQLVQPFSLTVDKSKVQDLYKMLKDAKIKSHEPTASTESQNTNLDINDILGAEIRKSECTKCLHFVLSTQTPKTTKNQEHAAPSFACHHDHLTKGVDNESVDLRSKVVNLTQIFNVHPRLLVVNSNIPVGEKIAGGTKKCSKPPPAKKGKDKSLDCDQRKPCVKSLGPVYYVDVDDMTQDFEG